MRLCVTAELKRRRKPSATPGWGPARCGGAARRDRMASACLRPPQKGPPHSGSAARGGTRQQKEGEKEIIERNKKLRHFQQMTQRKEEAKTMGANSRNTKGKMRKQQDRKPKIWERGRDEKNYKRSKGRQWKRFKSTGVKRQFLVSIDQEGWRKDAEANGKVFKVFILKKSNFWFSQGHTCEIYENFYSRRLIFCRSARLSW